MAKPAPVKVHAAPEKIRPPHEAAHQPAWVRLEDQLNWYDGKSSYNQNWYKRLKVLQVLLAVWIPVASLLDAGTAKWATAISGALIAVLEAVQHMYQFSTLWVTYRSTAEHLKHERFLFLSAAGPYRGLAMPERLTTLAERVEEHVSTEHANWVNEKARSMKEFEPGKEGPGGIGSSNRKKKHERRAEPSAG
ncbi:DUF4231 domain-containing protein [Geomonas azotofigens]|uniref:DUF4231 domain-containing protein n=1 Tax=Geomonas azotofigens TaxID=2843196 RepID=UPI001C106727|nr:DUF4231 domain-containing protein [Geomonas azotofigens]MBU5611436.1 DUF4231 domain-containing protein [Geomonas azotofigens]